MCRCSQKFTILFSVLLLCVCAHHLQADIIIADSFTEFSGVQGSNNWYYGYWQKTGDADGSYHYENEFVLFSQCGVYSVVGGIAWNTSSSYWTGVSAIGAHPNGVQTSSGKLAVEQWAIRRWVSPVAGKIDITGRLAKFNTSSNGDGVLGLIIVDGTTVFSRQLTATDGAGTNYSIIATVSSGTVIDFLVTPGSSSRDGNDGTRFSATMVLKEPVPSPIAINPVEKLSANSIRVGITNRPNKAFVIHASSNLTNWAAVFTNTASVPVVSYVETNILSSPQRFYRVEVREP